MQKKIILFSILMSLMLLSWIIMIWDLDGNKIYNIIKITLFTTLIIYSSQLIGIFILNKIKSEVKDNSYSYFVIGTPIIFVLIIILSKFFSLNLLHASIVTLCVSILLSLFIKCEYHSYSWADFFGLVLVWISITILLLPRIFALTIDDGGAIFRLWGDEYALATLLSNMSFSNSISQTQGLNASGLPLGFYHYGAYILGANIRALSDISSLDAIKSISAPFWLFYLATIIVLISQILGCKKFTSYLIAAVVLVMPDAYQVGFGNNYLGWHFNLLISPSMISGVSIGLISIIFLARYICYKNNADFIISLLFNILMLFYKVHLIVFLWPIYTIIIAWIFLYKFNHYIKFLICSIAIFFIYIFIVLISKNNSIFPLINFQYDGFKLFYRILVLTQENNFLSQFFKKNIDNGQYFLPLFYFAIYIVIFSFSYTIFSFLVRLKNKDKLLIYYQNLALIIFFAYIFWASFLSLDSRLIGTPDELMHRPFILLYAMLAILLVYQFFLFIENFPKIKRNLIAGLILFISYYFGITGYSSGATYKIDPNQNFRIESCAIKAINWVNKYKNARGVSQADTIDMTIMLSGMTDFSPYYIPRKPLKVLYPELARTREAHLTNIQNHFKNNVLTNEMSITPIDLYMTKSKNIPINKSLGFNIKYFECIDSEYYIVLYNKNLF